MQKKPVIFFLSKSGAGKDTQADLLVDEFGFDYFNTGDVFRALRRKENFKKPLRSSIEFYEAQGITRIIDKGRFVPTLCVVCHWRNALLVLARNHQQSKGIVLVGVARKIGEAMALHDFFETWPDAKKHFRLVPILINVSDKEVTRRLLARRQCVGCGKVIVGFTAEAALMACPKCGGHLMRRKDDTRPAIASRLREYRKYVAPVLNYFRAQNILITVNGEQSIEAVHKEVTRRIKL
ncbi:hypothetical protein A3J56_00960 [Candidatus Giovannonibacteria bacterium RIFCSPHIGHO2_02_FULL_46_20]|uniref:Adenylate kinase n=1 Tax=Candidatus Giovannonibacteria bacterium RIFCSPHIGHO2_02_FULL_46_20 TaxID=1798338 RepID=A0A1F5WGT8_9BACT|nr:MAG: hypothetical protein A3J56_00960 [Candidatus Giovannonibacteria bacterium RIFCSPHIGHO2_02_FULL_46_20]